MRARFPDGKRLQLEAIAKDVATGILTTGTPPQPPLPPAAAQWPHGSYGMSAPRRRSRPIRIQRSSSSRSTSPASSSGRLAASRASPWGSATRLDLWSTCLSVTGQARSKQLCGGYPQVLATILMAAPNRSIRKPRPRPTTPPGQGRVQVPDHRQNEFWMPRCSSCRACGAACGTARHA